MNLNTDSQRDAFKITMKVLGSQTEVNRRKMCKILTKGNEPYERSSDAGSFLKDLVKSDNYPVERKENSLVRTDVKKVVN